MFILLSYIFPNTCRELLYARTHWKHIQLQFLSICAKINSFGPFADNTGHVSSTPCFSEVDICVYFAFHHKYLNRSPLYVCQYILFPNFSQTQSLRPIFWYMYCNRTRTSILSNWLYNLKKSMFYANIISVDIKSAPKIRARMVQFFCVSFRNVATFKQLSYEAHMQAYSIWFELLYCRCSLARK